MAPEASQGSAAEEDGDGAPGSMQAAFLPPVATCADRQKPDSHSTPDGISAAGLDTSMYVSVSTACRKAALQQNVGQAVA